MITKPLFPGAAQVIETLVPETVVVGADGVEGTVAGIFAQSPLLDAAEIPLALIAFIRA